MAPRNVAVFCPFVLAPPQFGTDLELVQRHIDQGDHVTVLVCDGELPACDANLAHRPDRCTACMEIRSAGLALLSERVSVTRLSRYAPSDIGEMAFEDDFADLQQLRRYTIDGFDIGYAAVSSLIYALRDAHCDLTRHATLLRNVLRTAFTVFRSCEEYLRRHPTDTMYVTNSRFASTRGIMRACQRAGVECLVYDRGNDVQHYALYPNTFPHDREFVEREMRQRWRDARDVPDREEQAAVWFRNKSVGVELAWKSFVAGQQAGRLPDDWDPDRRNVVIFTSSEDEFVGIGAGWENPIYPSELDGVQSIVESLRQSPHDLHVYVRVHPNLTGIDNRQTQGLRALSAPFLTVIPPDSPLSTYALLTNAEKVLTFGSTIGIEAVYWQVPSILAGISYYRNLGSTYNPASHDEVMALLAARLPPQDVEAALMYGYYLRSFGTPFRYFRASGIMSGAFKGQDLWGSRGLRPL